MSYFEASVRDASPVDLLYSLLYAYGSRRGGELPGPWLVAALTEFGHRESTVRQTLFRMLRERDLEARREGRVKWYRLSRYGRTEADIGRDKIFEPSDGEWDGQWTMVSYRFHTDERVDRDHAREILELDGFAALAPGVYLHPRDKAGRVLEAARSAGLEGRLVAFRGARIGGETDEALAERLWDLDRIAKGYRAFLDRFGSLRRRRRFVPREAFAVRLALVLAFLDVAWDDPDLPPSLLPKSWPREAARQAAAHLYEVLLPPTMAFGDALMERTGLRVRVTG